MRLFIVISVAFFVASCGSGNFQGSRDKKKDSQKQPNSGDAEAPRDDQADEPVMIGGGYLACVMTDAQNKEIACALNEKQSGNKINLSSYQSTWHVKDTDHKIQVVKTEPGKLESPHHLRVFYDDDSYLNHYVELTVSSRSGKTARYLKQLNEMDSNLRSSGFSHAKGGSLAIENLFLLGSISPKQLIDGKKETAFKNRAEAFGKLIDLGITMIDDLCHKGEPNILTLAQQYGPFHPAGTNVSIKRRTNFCFVTNGAPNSIYDLKEDSSCLIVPVLINSGSNLHFRRMIFRDPGIKPNMIRQIAQTNNLGC